MSDKPKALVLAEKLEHQVHRGSYDWERVEPMMLKAAAELRRLHDLLGKANALCRIRQTKIESDEALLRQALDRLDTARYNEADPVVRQHYEETITALQERLE
jgi:hypothetical protein